MNRPDELMLDIAGHFDNLSAIAHEEWTREKDVSLDEIHNLFPACSLVLEGYARSTPNNKARILKIMAEGLAL